MHVLESFSIAPQMLSFLHDFSQMSANAVVNATIAQLFHGHAEHPWSRIIIHSVLLTAAALLMPFELFLT